MILKKIIQAAKNNEAQAQKILYDQYSGKMLSVCRAYIKEIQAAEDCMIKGFCKGLQSLQQLKDPERFEFWLKKIMVNECLNYLRSYTNMMMVVSDEIESKEIYQPEIEEDTEVQQLLDALPDGYKTVLLLYEVEEYSHKEIAELLNISENTSRTQLFKAKKKFMELYTKQMAAVSMPENIIR